VSGIQLCADMLAGDNSKVSCLSERDFSNLDELAAQCARALRNLSINGRRKSRCMRSLYLCCFPSVENKKKIVELGADEALQSLMGVNNERIAQQASD
jgi:type IV secretory pathway VirB4 component